MSTVLFHEVRKAFVPEKEPSPVSLTLKHGSSKLFRTVPYVPCDPWGPLFLELRDIDMPVAALGLVVISTPDCTIAAKRIQPRDGDGPGWALLEEVRTWTKFERYFLPPKEQLPRVVGEKYSDDKITVELAILYERTSEPKCTFATYRASANDGRDHFVVNCYDGGIITAPSVVFNHTFSCDDQLAPRSEP